MNSWNCCQSCSERVMPAQRARHVGVSSLRSGPSRSQPGCQYRGTSDGDYEPTLKFGALSPSRRAMLMNALVVERDRRVKCGCWGGGA